jgi:hypothetical protein
MAGNPDIENYVLRKLISLDPIDFEALDFMGCFSIEEFLWRNIAFNA